MPKRKRRPPAVPPHANAAPHAKVMAWLRSASAPEVMAASVRAGVYRPDGSLARPYGGR